MTSPVERSESNKIPLGCGIMVLESLFSRKFDFSSSEVFEYAHLFKESCLRVVKAAGAIRCCGLLKWKDS